MLLVAIFAFGCEASTTTAEAAVPTTQATTTTTKAGSATTQQTVGGQVPSDEVISMLEGRIAAWNRGDAQAAAAFYMVDGSLEEQDNGLVTKGRAQIASRLHGLMADFKMEAVGTPIQWGRVVVEPINLILQGQPGPYLLVFELGPDGRKIYRQWVMAAGPWVESDD
jgi:hypothetical protein